MRPERPVLFLISPSKTPCGVEMFARGFAAATRELGVKTETLAADGRPSDIVALWRQLAGAGALVVNLPVVAWKKALLLPLVALLMARGRGVAPVVVLHEWADLNPLRRAFIGLYLLAARVVLFSSPTVRREFASSFIARWPLTTGLVPIPPNIAPPERRFASPLVERLAQERARGRLVLGHFGSIYPRKQSALVLDIADALKRSGTDVFVVFIGGFIKGHDDVEGQFRARARALGLEDDILVTGYVETDAEIFALFEAVDVFAYCFHEGLTSRRGSVLACLQSGRPVVVNAPSLATEFDHHPAFKRLIASGALRFVPTDADPREFARVISMLGGQGRIQPLFFAGAWRDAALALRGALAPSDLARGAAEGRIRKA